MKIALVSDIHANMDAFEAVLADIDRVKAEAVFSLGDNIGYGAEPERVIQTLQDRRIPSVVGNHELAARRPGFLDWFNPTARQSLSMTFQQLSAASLKWISGLPMHRQVGDGRLVHGFPPDSATLYLFQMPGAEKCRALQDIPERICFVGHTHLLELIRLDGGSLADVRFVEGLNRLEPALKFFVNIGSVGQPRDGDLRAKYVVWDPDADTLEMRCVPYDSRAAAAKIIAAGLPEAHARRLLE